MPQPLSQPPPRPFPLEEALRAVLEGTELAATRRGNTVTVAPWAAPAAA